MYKDRIIISWSGVQGAQGYLIRRIAHKTSYGDIEPDDYYFDGTNTTTGKTIGIKNFSLSNTTFSIAGWFKLAASINSGSAEYLICLNNNAYTSDMQFALAHRSRGLFVIVNNTEWTIQTLTLDTWYHIALTFGNDIANVYINGELVNTKTISSTPYTGSNLNIGSRSASVDGTSHSYYSKIYANDIRIYDHTLSPKEVKKISEGLIVHYTLSNNDNWLYPNNERTITRSSSGNTFIDYNYYSDLISCTETNYIVDFWAKGSVNNMGLDVYFRNSSGSAYVLTEKQNLTTNWVHYQLPLNGSPSSLNLFRARCYSGTANDIIYIRNMKLLSNNMPRRNNIEYDISGYNNNGTVTGSLKYNIYSPKYTINQYFSGSSNYIRTEAGTFSWFDFNQCTISVWMNPPIAPSSYTGSVGIGHNSVDGYYSKCFSICNSSGNFKINAAKGSNWIFIDSSYVCPLNEWHHYAATLNGTDVKMYVDGQQIYTTTIDWGSAITAYDTCVQVAIDLPGSDENYQGYYSDSRIYTTALSANDIAELYNTSKIVDSSGNILAREVI